MACCLFRTNHGLNQYSEVICGLTVSHIEAETNERHFADDIFKWIFLNENAWTSLNISLKFVPKVRINNIPALVQIMAWRRPGDKPLSEPMMVSLLTHICVTRPQWVNRWLTWKAAATTGIVLSGTVLTRSDTTHYCVQHSSDCSVDRT